MHSPSFLPYMLNPPSYVSYRTLGRLSRIIPLNRVHNDIPVQIRSRHWVIPTYRFSPEGGVDRFLQVSHVITGYAHITNDVRGIASRI